MRPLILQYLSHGVKNPKPIIVMLLALFILAGLVYIVFLRAASQGSGLEAEQGDTQSNATIVSDSSASGGANVTFRSGIISQGEIKPQVKGMVDRFAYDSGRDISQQNIVIPAAFVGSINNIVVMLNWDQLQSTSSTLDTSYIDDAINEARVRNIHIKLRILTGIHAPNWVKSIDNGPFNVYDKDSSTGQVFTGTSPKFWTAEYKTAYSDLMQKLAAKYDKEPTISSVVDSMCGTIFAEPFIRNYSDGDNITTYRQAGLTKSLDEQCQNNSIDIHNQWWKHTRTETALNPLAYVGTDSMGKPIEKFDADFTINWVARCRQILSTRCIMGNNGFNVTSYSLGYRQVLGAVICQGNPPPYFQTRQMAVIQNSGHTLEDVAQYAVDVGAGMLELPSGYQNVTTASKLAQFNAALMANSVIPCPADRLLPQPH